MGEKEEVQTNPNSSIRFIKLMTTLESRDAIIVDGGTVLIDHPASEGGLVLGLLELESTLEQHDCTITYSEFEKLADMLSVTIENQSYKLTIGNQTNTDYWLKIDENTGIVIRRTSTAFSDTFFDIKTRSELQLQ